jgi:RimJ/RimL family protein N-acetyltransferase
MKLNDIKQKDFDFIYELTSNKIVMKHIVDGKVWNEEKTQRFVRFSIEEQDLENRKRNQFYYIINVPLEDREGDRPIGIIGFFQEKDKNYYLRVFLNPNEQGKGYFSKSLSLVINRLKTYKNIDKLYADVHQTNEKMNKILSKKYFFNKVKYYKEKATNQYIIYLRPYTYLVKSDFISERVIDHLFKLRGNWKKYDSSMGRNPDYIRLDGKHYYDKSNYKYKSILKNIVNDKKNKITVKSELIKTMGNSPYMLNTFIFDHLEELNKIKEKMINEDRAWILKPDRGFAGDAIQVVRKRDFKDLKLHPKYSRWSIQEYIENPLLVDGRKFHLRVLFLYRAKGFSFWFKKIPVYLAAKKFVYDNFDDHEIHISHYSEKEPARYIEDLSFNKKQLINIIKQLKIIMSDLADKIKDAGCYERDSIRCYEIFGIDLMLTDDLDLKLIEVNSKVGFKEFVNDEYEFNKNLLKSELEITTDYFLPPKNEIEKERCDFVKI